jgi:GNAT superfamily N-acetyltransferase
MPAKSETPKKILKPCAVVTVGHRGNSAVPNSVRVREAKLADAAGIAAVVHAMAELHSVARQPSENTSRTIRANLRKMDAAGSSTAYVAEAPSDTIIGYAAVHWVPMLVLSGGEAYVTELFVRPPSSGNGVGSLLLDRVVKEAKGRGCARVSLLNGRDCDSYRRRFYKNRGWTERSGMANFILPIAGGA